MTKITAVPTNIITGFLGAGKTSVILHLLNNKPAGERWAVLVNEFGEVGVDGSLFAGQGAKEQNIFITEVPGGCMCCAAGLPMHIALNQLLARAKPDRLLIEPTGLGHPKEILEVLSAAHYREVLSIGPTFTLVDARNLADDRYTSHDTFNQQIDIADCIVGSKSDLYTDGDREALVQYIGERKGACPVVFAEQGEIDLALLTTGAIDHIQHHHQADPASTLYTVTNRAAVTPKLAPMQNAINRPDDKPLPECGYLKSMNSGEGFTSVGWRFAPNQRFHRQRFIDWLHQQQAQRLKAVVITPEGVFGYNATADGITETELDDCLESRIEVIALAESDAIKPDIEARLLQCLAIDD